MKFLNVKLRASSSYCPIQTEKYKMTINDEIPK